MNDSLKRRKAQYIIEKNKIELEGTGTNSGREYYLVAGVKLITYIEKTPVDQRKGRMQYNYERKFICFCKDCSVVRTPKNLPPRCVYSLALKMYLEDEEDGNA